MIKQHTPRKLDGLDIDKIASIKDSFGTIDKQKQLIWDELLKM